MGQGTWRRRASALASVLGFALATVVAATPVVASAQVTSGPPASGIPARAPLLTVLPAERGTFDGKRLTLTGVPEQATWFTDRPVRRAGLFDIPQMLEIFFARQSPPNAALEVQGADESRDVVIVELAKPRYDRARGTLRFSAEVLPRDRVLRSGPLGLVDFATRNDAALPERFGRAVVFIDAAADSGPATTNVELQILENTYNNTVLGMQDDLTGLQQQYAQSPAPCVMAMIQQLTEYLDDMSNVGTQLDQLVTDANANGGNIPPKDATLLQQVQAGISTGQANDALVENEASTFAQNGSCTVPPPWNPGGA